MNDLVFILKDTLGHFSILDFLKISIQVLSGPEIDCVQYVKLTYAIKCRGPQYLYVYYSDFGT